LEIAEYVKTLFSDEQIIHFADPAIGSGSFFSAALATFGRDRFKSAVGVELDSAFAEVARDLWASDGLEVVCGDFTRFVANGSFRPPPNLVFANPPYVRHHHLGHADKRRLKALAQRVTGVEVNGLAGLYVYFLLLATASMGDGGYAAWLIPSEFMDVNYGVALRRFLTDHVTLIRAHRFDPDDVQFGDALVSSVALVFRKAPPVGGHSVRFTFGGSVRVPHAADVIPLGELRESRKWTVYPDHAKNDRCISDDGGGPALADFFRIQRGIATGCNRFFILGRADAKLRALPAEYLRPILPSPRYLKTTVVETEDDGYPRMNQQYCVIDCDLPEHLIEERHPELWEYLQAAEALGVRKGYLVNKRRPWYKQEHRDPAPFLCTYMGRGANNKQPFRFILNRSKAISTNLYLMLHPQKALAAMLRKHPSRAVEVHGLLRSVSGHELRGEGRVYGGGLHKIEPKELGRISAAPLVKRWPELTFVQQRRDTPSLFG
jgi:hypothetical protein